MHSDVALNRFFNYKKTIIFLVAIIIGTAFWFIIPENYKQNESTDYIHNYEPVAESFLNFDLNNIYSSLGFKYPPGFSIILAFLFKISIFSGINKNIIIFSFSIICVGISAIILFEISKLFWNDKISIIVPFSFLFYPLLLWTTKQPNSETPFIPLFLLSVYLLLKVLNLNKGNITFSIYIGIITGFLMLIRPIAIGLPFIASFLILFIKTNKTLSQKFLLSCLVLLGAFITVLPWELYIYEKENKIVLLSTNGGSSMFDGLTFNVNMKNYRIKKNLPEDVNNLMTEINNNLSLKSSVGEISSFMYLKLKENPVPVLKLFLIKAIRTLYATDSQRNETPILIIQFFLLILIFTSFVITWKNFIDIRKYLIILSIYFLYFWGMSVLVLSIVRYMLPVLCVLFVFFPSILIKFNFFKDNFNVSDNSNLG